MTDPNTLPNRPIDPLRTQVEEVLSTTYDLGDEIGRGGMGIVFRARDRRLQRNVAIKILPPQLAFQQDIRSRFLREAATSAQLSHPNIVPIFTVDEAGDIVFFVMGLVTGVNLAQYIHDNGVASASETVRILREIAGALAYAHSRNVIHRDIKPDNILLDAETGRVMVTDFGIARAVMEGTDNRLTTTGVAIGTPAYMSPEQSAGDQNVDGRSDLYSLGVVGYQLLCGEPPFSAPNTPAMLVKHITERPKPLGERCSVPMGLSDIIMQCLAKDPNDRFSSAEDLIFALDAYAALGDAGVSEIRPYRQEGLSPASKLATGVAGVGVANGQPASSMSQLDDDAHRQAMIARWEAAPVKKYRRRVVTFLVVNAVFAVLSILGEQQLFGISAIWAVWLAFSYSRLWSAGYDWRDVLRLPSDALMVDVLGERIDDTKALFDPVAREQVRERMRERKRVGQGLFVPSPTLPVPAPAALPLQLPYATAGNGGSAISPGVQSLTSQLAAQLPNVRDAEVLRREIAQMYDELMKEDRLSNQDRASMPNVVQSADALLVRVRALSASEYELSQANVPGVSAAIEQEIFELEEEANPLDEERSELRIRRLVQLRRQRLAVRDVQRRYAEVEQKLQRCMSAMRSMHLDLIRFRSGLRTTDNITQIANEAMVLGREVDAILYAQDEMAKLLGRS